MKAPLFILPIAIGFLMVGCNLVGETEVRQRMSEVLRGLPVEQLDYLKSTVNCLVAVATLVIDDELTRSLLHPDGEIGSDVWIRLPSILQAIERNGLGLTASELSALTDTWVTSKNCEPESPSIGNVSGVGPILAYWQSDQNSLYWIQLSDQTTLFYFGGGN